MNFASLPDSVFKLFVYLGIGLIVYAFINRQNEFVDFEKQRIEYNSNLKKLDNERKFLDSELSSIAEEADFYSKKFNIANPLTVTDSGYTFSKTIRGEKNDIALSDTISHLLLRFTNKQKEIAQKDGELSVQRYEIDEKSYAFKQIDRFSIGQVILGFVLLIAGLIQWHWSDKEKDKLLLRQNLALPTFSFYCQSCGVAFNSMTKYGTNDKGDLNYHFCINCYANGAFTDQEITPQKMIENTKLHYPKLSERRMNKYQKHLNSLDRWRFDKFR